MFRLRYGEPIARLPELAVIFLLLLLPVAGCVHLQPDEARLIQQSRYAELEQLMQGRIVNPAASPTSELFYLCYAYSRVKRYNKLFPCLEHLQKNIDRGDNKLFFFDFSSAPALMLAEAHMELGDLARSLEEARKAYQLTQGANAYVQMKVYALTALGLAHALRGEAAEAGRYARELEDVSIGYTETLVASDKYIGLARIYIALKRYPDALTAIRKDEENDAFKAFTDAITGASMEGVSLFTYWELPRRYMLNKALLETGDLAGARAGFDQLLQMPQTGDSGDIHWLILLDRGRIAEADGDLDLAIRLYEKAVEIIERQRATIHTEASKIGFVGDKQEVYQRLVAALFARKRHPDAFGYVERAKSRALVDLLAARTDLGGRTADPQAVRQMLAGLARAEGEAAAQDASSGKQRERLAMVSQMKAAIASQAPQELLSLVAVSSLPLKEIQSRIQPDETLIEYYYGGNSLYAFVLAPGAFQAVALDGAGLQEEVGQFRKLLQSPSSTAYEELSRSLYRRLFQPLLQLVKTPRLVIVPHGALHYLPFGALHSGTEYLVERFAFRILPSASVLDFLQGRAGTGTKKMLVIGNPSLDLQFAESEAREIGKLLLGSEVVLRKNATETLIREIAEGFDYLHFATHGKFFAETPLVSGLSFAPDEKNDGLLTLGELYSLRLKADLVTLSACETGLGRITGGDDMVGLIRGFFYAGAKSVVASLWSVDDQATADLMLMFYPALEKESPSAALRKAQLAVLKQHPHPFYWAAFQLSGRDR